MKRAFVIIALFGCSGCLDPAARPTAIEGQIRELLGDQAAEWNRGDIDAFMEYYWKNDGLTFSTGGRTLHGWQETIERYKRRYPTPEAMGELDFSELTIEPLGDNAVMVLGRWRVRAKQRLLSGNFTLVLRRIDGRWLIIHDHTSQDPPRVSGS